MTTAEDQDRREANAIVERRDESAFRSMYARHTPALIGIALRLLDEDKDAEDAVRDTWLKAVQGLPKFEWRIPLRTWLAGILVTQCSGRWGDSESAEKAASDAQTATLPAADDQAVAKASRVDLERALAGLPPDHRAMLLLHDVEGWTHDAIATQLAIGKDISKSRLSQARLALRRRLAAETSTTPTDS